MQTSSDCGGVIPGRDVPGDGNHGCQQTRGEDGVSERVVRETCDPEAMRSHGRGDTDEQPL